MLEKSCAGERPVQVKPWCMLNSLINTCSCETPAYVKCKCMWNLNWSKTCKKLVNMKCQSMWNIFSMLMWIVSACDMPVHVKRRCMLKTGPYQIPVYVKQQTMWHVRGCKFWCMRNASASETPVKVKHWCRWNTDAYEALVNVTNQCMWNAGASERQLYTQNTGVLLQTGINPNGYYDLFRVWNFSGDNYWWCGHFCSAGDTC